VEEEKNVLKNWRIGHLNMPGRNVIAPGYLVAIADRISTANLCNGSFKFF
jgi:hypothetical protein